MRIYAYYPTWSIYARNFKISDIPNDSITHLTVAFAKLKPSGMIDSEEIERLDLQKNSYRFKLGIAIGGWGQHEEFSIVLKNEGTRLVFVECCVKITQKYNFDHMELDWEFPSEDTDVKAYIETIIMLKEALGAKVDLGICLPCYKCKYDSAEMINRIDYVVVMGYDQSGPWSQVSAYHSALNPIVSEYIKYLAEDVSVPRSKILLGIPFYGRTFAECSGAGEQFRGPGYGSYGEKGTIDYGEIIESGIDLHYDADAVSNYANIGGDFVSFDGPESVAAKIDFIRSENLSGIAVWNISGDSKNSKTSLLLCIGRLMKN